MRQLSKLVVAASLCVPTIVCAVPVNYEFTANWSKGDLAGTVSTGHFSFDSSRIVPGEMVETLDLFDSFDFTLKGYHYTTASVNTVFASFNHAGGLTGILFGSNCAYGPDLWSGEIVAQCIVQAGREDHFLFDYRVGFPKWSVALAGDLGPGNVVGVSTGQSSIRLLSESAPSQVPEPTAALLLLTGLGLLSANQLHRKRS